MTSERLQEFLKEANLMDIATITEEGFPHVTPVWFDYDGTHFFFSTTKERVKSKNMEKNKKVGFSIAPKELPYAAVVGYGTAEITDDPNGTLLKKMCHKYLPADKADTFFETLMNAGGSRIIVKITPSKISHWQG